MGFENYIHLRPTDHRQPLGYPYKGNVTMNEPYQEIFEAALTDH